MNERRITRKYLKDHPNEIFVFGDNYHRSGRGGAAILRDEPNVYGFITKKTPGANSEDYFTIAEYRSVFELELEKLIAVISKNPDKTYLVSRIGGGIANRHGIFEEIIEPRIKKALKQIQNVKFLW
ncbi:MAG: hypothetical protein ACFFE8_04570 [Candidatus Heimdallarchaeota archaeon]